MSKSAASKETKTKWGNFNGFTQYQNNNFEPFEVKCKSPFLVV